MELKNTMSEMKNEIESFSSMLNQVEERICELEEKSFELIQSEGKKRIKKTEENLWNLWAIIKRINIHILVISKGKEEENRAESLCKEIVAENFPNIGRGMDTQIHEGEKSPNKINPNKIMRQIIIKLSKVNEKDSSKTKDTILLQKK